MKIKHDKEKNQEIEKFEQINPNYVINRLRNTK